MRTAAPTPDPDRDPGLALPPALPRTKVSPLPGIVGQADAARNVAATLLRFLHCGSTGPIGVIGPAGVGKTTTVLRVAEALSLPCQRLHLDSIQSQDDLVAAVIALHKEASPDLPSLVLVDGLGGAPVEALREVIALAKGKGPRRHYLRDGEPIPLQFSNCQWVFEAPAINLEESAGEVRAVLTWMSERFHTEVDQVFLFSSLSKRDLFEILATTDFAPYREAQRRLLNVGIEFELSELEMHAVAKEAHSIHLHQGAHGLAKVLQRGENRIWRKLADLRLRQQAQDQPDWAKILAGGAQ